MAWLQTRTTSKGKKRYDVHWWDDTVLNDKFKPTHRSKVFTTKVDADRFMRELEAAQARGDWIDPAAGKVTFGSYATSWLGAREKNLSPRTAEVYRSTLKNHLLPTFERTQIGRITLTAVRGWYTTLAAKAGRTDQGISQATMAKVRARLDKLVAVFDRWIDLG